MLCGTLEWFVASIIYLDFTKFACIQNPFIDEEDDEFGLTSIEKE